MFLIKNFFIIISDVSIIVGIQHYFMLVAGVQGGG